MLADKGKLTRPPQDVVSADMGSGPRHLTHRLPIRRPEWVAGLGTRPVSLVPFKTPRLWAHRVRVTPAATCSSVCPEASARELETPALTGHLVQALDRRGHRPRAARPADTLVTTPGSPGRTPAHHLPTPALRRSLHILKTQLGPWLPSQAPPRCGKAPGRRARRSLCARQPTSTPNEPHR